MLQDIIDGRNCRNEPSAHVRVWIYNSEIHVLARLLGSVDLNCRMTATCIL